jgi:hypothetical protein
MAKRQLADVLWEAANRWLTHNGFLHGFDQWFSCNAIETALGGPNDWIGAFRRFPDVEAWLVELGCPVHSNWALTEFNAGEERQGVRYMWLLLAMHVAEDEGITV